MNRVKQALDTALDYLVMVAVTLAPVIFPRALDRQVTVREHRSNPGNTPPSTPDTPNDKTEEGRS